MNEHPPFEEDLALVLASYESYRAAMNARIVGYPEIVERLFEAFLCEGNVLLEGAPGLGKTSLVKAYAGRLGLSFGRVQFTPDLMPLDVIGSSLIETGQSGGRSYRFYPGPIFANIVLGDEINRATPKTQSAFLEAMEEKRVTFLGESHALPSPFMVVATQNPIELEGTYPLPEAQVDRFLMKLSFKAPDFRSLKTILAVHEAALPSSPAYDNELGAKEAHAAEEAEKRAAESMALLEAWRRIEARIVVPEDLRSFIVRLVLSTHPGSSEAEAVKRYVLYGASPRCAIGLVRSARAKAACEGRANVAYEDVETLFSDVTLHRLSLNFEAETEGVAKPAILDAALNAARRELR